MPWNRSDNPTGIERLVAALCYLTGGIAGIIYIIARGARSDAVFFRFHFLQAIILMILSFLLNWAFKAMGVIVTPLLPLLSDAMTSLPAAFSSGVIVGLSNFINIFFTALSLLSLYCIIWAALGKYAEIPFVSNLVRQQLR